MCSLATMKLADKLILLRDRLGYSQSELARLSGIPQQRISTWEAGKGRIYGDQVQALATALQVSTDYLLNDALDDPPFLPVGELQSFVWQVIKTIGWEEARDRLLTRPLGVPLVPFTRQDLNLSSDPNRHN